MYLEYDDIYDFLTVGDLINDIKIEEVLVERICYDTDRHYGNMEEFFDSKIGSDDKKWLFYVCIFKNGNQAYLHLDANPHSSVYDELLYESDEFPNCGLTSISWGIAKELCYKLSQFGKEISLYKIQNFERTISTIVSIIPCEVKFLPLFIDAGGYFQNGIQQITIGNNQSHLMILFSLIHEYTHFLLQDSDIIKISPETIKEYIVNPEELICNLVAYSVCSKLLPESITKNKNFEQWRDIKRMLSESVFDKEYVLGKTKFYSDKILEEYAGVNQSEVTVLKDQLVTELYVLPEEENKKLFELILNDISPLIPNV